MVCLSILAVVIVVVICEGVIGVVSGLGLVLLVGVVLVCCFSVYNVCCIVSSLLWVLFCFSCMGVLMCRCSGWL